ncbi:MAG: T9SS type A sorting domain-containing protein [Chitinophagaceae bacterium]|nr:T9SS type A sorting domain-containing protein [Chitinophagaceae bacterium]
MKITMTILLLALASYNSHAQYAPQAGLPGSTAMYKDSSAFIDWASNCLIQRGWLHITDTTLGKTTAGDATNAFGKADGNIVSLGDAGEALFFFENPIINGPGFDFAIFENGFLSPFDSNLAYLELAQVEVSNDGFTFFRFPPICENDTTIQIGGAGDYMDAQHIHNLAGKYIANYGTPFELSELSTQSGLDINDIHYIKVKDIIGSLDENTCVRDANSHTINDPYPTPFPTGGFDLDAIGIIHQKFSTGFSNATIDNTKLFYPNPTNGILHCKNWKAIDEIALYSLEGKVLIRQSGPADDFNLTSLPKGQYALSLRFKNGQQHHQLISKYE